MPKNPSAMKVAELKTALKALGQPVGGNKAALVARLLSATAGAAEGGGVAAGAQTVTTAKVRPARAPACVPTRGLLLALPCAVLVLLRADDAPPPPPTLSRSLPFVPRRCPSAISSAPC